MELNGRALTLAEIAAVACDGAPVQVAASARPRILASRKVVEDIIARDAVVYGVSTGFGKLSDVRIPSDGLGQLQLNLVRSHACGIGDPLSEPEVRAMMLLRANVLALGFSGVRFEIIEMLCEMLNRRLCPVVPEKGSVGASGDQRLHGYDGDTGAVIFAGGGANELMAGTHSYNTTGIEARGRIYIAADNKVYAFRVRR